jgi:hypothetical protein
LVRLLGPGWEERREYQARHRHHATIRDSSHERREWTGFDAAETLGYHINTGEVIEVLVSDAFIWSFAQHRVNATSVIQATSP